MTDVIFFVIANAVGVRQSSQYKYRKLDALISFARHDDNSFKSICETPELFQFTYCLQDFLHMARHLNFTPFTAQYALFINQKSTTFYATRFFSV